MLTIGSTGVLTALRCRLRLWTQKRLTAVYQPQANDNARGLEVINESGDMLLDCLPSAESRCPSPLKIVPTEMAGHIDHFTNKEQPRYFPGLHGFCGELVRVDPAGSHLGFFVAFGTVGQDLPVMNLELHFIESGIGPPFRRMQFEPALRQSNG